MIINANSKISDILKENPKAIDVIASINIHFRKLKNPILRKVLASRVKVFDAARIGNVAPEIILLELQKIGFAIENSTEASLPEKNQQLPAELTDPLVNINITDYPDEVITMDVRPILDGGEDPFNHIMKKLKELHPGQKLLVINSFEPVPLINLLKEKGYKSISTRPVQGEVHTIFFKASEPLNEKNDQTGIFENDQVLFDNKLLEYSGSSKVIDVRELEMPMPMVTILKEIELLEDGLALLVEHKKFPQFLLEELSTRGYSLVSKELSESHTRLLIYR